jgi:tRNA(adenine34) deaminase
MALALAQAQLAMAANEVPVGAVLVRNGEVIATGRNAPIGGTDPTGHAEILALRAAALKLGNYRLDDCELFVTLEPCAMCAGAMLHARLKRVVFGALDPKTGAAGSVLNLFSNPQINHHTKVQGGVIADECAAVLQSFFQERREERRSNHEPIREDAVRPDDAQFLSLPDYPWAPHYVSDLPSLAGLRMHYLDEGSITAPLTYLCLHGHNAWSYVYRSMIPVLLSDGSRVVVPDMVGFGKSDKPKKERMHSLAWHRQLLLEFMDRLGLERIVLLVQQGNQALARALVEADSERFVALQVLKSAQLGEMTTCADQASFPDRGHRAALRAFVTMMAEAGPSATNISASNRSADSAPH